jgi:type IV secretory pathway ATPase VirB11/archaellum biosynthesis ATPase
LIPKPPVKANLCKSYNVNETTVKLYELPDGSESLYHIEPPEYNLPKFKLELIEHVKNELVGHIPEGLNVRHPKKIIEYIESFGHRTIASYLQREGLNMGRTRSEERSAIRELTKLIAKYTAGFGLVEVLLEDNNIQDIYVDAPVENNHIYISTGPLGDSRLSSKFKTNIIMTSDAAESLMSRFRFESGRAFSEAHPLLECDNELFKTRVTVIGAPVSPKGLAFALRRHSSDPWTLPRLIQAGSITSQAAGLISFLIDGQSTILIAGGRGAGKSSLLGAVMFEFSPVQRILTIEDTLELPGPLMQELGYKLQTMHIQSSVRGEGSMTADEALRISLRLGESAIVLGEVRGEEARTLYEAMRAGTAGSSVLGTFHADSARAVFERVVFDMGITAEAFSSTDIVIIAGLTRPAGIQRQHRRVVQIAELVKGADNPGTFDNLLYYDSNKDALVASERFLESSDRLSGIAKSWGLSYSEMLDNIKARAELKQSMVDYASRTGTNSVLSGRWVFRCNSVFWELISRQHTREQVIDYKKLVRDWKKWFVKAVVNE